MLPKTLRKTIFDESLSGLTYDQIKFRHFYQWVDEKAETNEYGNGRKIALRDALVGTDAYETAFPSRVDNDVDEDRNIADYADA